jgi:hypothetical protein
MRPACGRILGVGFNLATPLKNMSSAVGSMDWFKGKIYTKPWFLPSNIGVSCKFSHHPIL